MMFQSIIFQSMIVHSMTVQSMIVRSMTGGKFRRGHIGMSTSKHASLAGAPVPQGLAFFVAEHESVGTLHELADKDHVRRFLLNL
jgi:hypothetical protein